MTLVDLSKLPVPDAIETLDYEAILAARKAHMVELFAAAGVMADWNPDLESDPIVVMLQENAYREVTLRARVNDGIRAVMLASALGADLDQLGANYNVPRLIVTPANPNAIPPVAEVLESDERYRRRIQLAFEGFSTAGPVGAYLFHALSANADVLDCSIERAPRPGDILVTVLSTIGDGTASPELLAQVEAALNHEAVRPLNDTVVVAGAEIMPYAIAATLEIGDGPDGETVRQAAMAAVQIYADSVHAVGAVVALSGIDGALHRAGVKRVVRTQPVADIVCTSGQAPFCTGITVTVA